MNLNKKNILLIALALVLYITGFLSSYPYLLQFDRVSSSRIDTIRSIAEYSVMFLSFLAFCVIFLSRNTFLKIVGYLLILIVSLNFMLSASCFFIYKQGFNVGMMMSILDTNISESISMAKTLVFPTIVTILFFIILCLVFVSGSKKQENKRYNKILSFFAFLWLLLPLAFYFKHRYISNKGGGFTIKNIVYHSMDLKNAMSLKTQIDEIKNTKVDYHLEKNQEEPVENIVVLMGESVRKHNMSLYGYTRDTTPFANKEKSNMLLYKNAHSPASITNLAVPIVLSNIDINYYNREITGLSDNVLNVGKHIGYDTYWLSTQGGAHGITAIASFAETKKWLNGFDNVLIPELKAALKNPSKKKLIVLHINGSHPYCCDKYPKNETIWSGDIDECYDNSIRYTDKVIGNILNELRGTSSVLIYLSDHGQVKIDGKYIHGDYREASEIPYFIWYSDKVNSLNKGKEIEELTSTTTLYSNILYLMGVKNPKTIDNTGKFLQLDLKPILYKDLK